MYYNVLPDEVKADLRKEYRLRLAIVAFFGLAIIFLIATVALLPSLISVLVKEGNMELQKEALEKLKQTQGLESTSKEITVTKDKIKALEQDDLKYLPSEIIAKMLGLKSSGIVLTDILYEPRNDKSVMVITGIADTRAELVAFRDAIEKTDPFETTDLPVGVFAKSTDIAFTITIGGEF